MEDEREGNKTRPGSLGASEMNTTSPRIINGRLHFLSLPVSENRAGQREQLWARRGAKGAGPS